MSNEKMRSDFEYYYWIKWRDADTFACAAWKAAWQASRAALCVELPRVGICAMTNDLIGYTRGIRDCRSAIESTGVRVK